ncbi:MAG: TolC family protein [Bacteroidales bacterium]|nr:TolC family protein [Bacteroidales bacterium]
MGKLYINMGKKIPLLFIAILCLSLVQAQDTNVPEEYSTENLLNLKLPPLEVLLEGARSSSQVEFYNLRMEGEELTLKTERRKWQEYFSFYGSYQYGLLAMNTETDIGGGYPLIYQYSGTAQSWYSAGVSLRLPLDQLFDRKNRIRRQQIKIEETLKERELWYDEHKMRIIELYTKAVEMSNSLKFAVELFSVSDAQYQMAQKDYILGTITAQGLNVAKSQQVTAMLQMERVKAELNSAILRMEIMSGVQIINRK